MTSDPKEALERLRTSVRKADEHAVTTWIVDVADLRALLAEREGREREVAYTENRRAHWQHEAEAEHSRAAALAIDYENMSINRDTLKARAEAAEAQLSALQAAMELVQARALKDSNATIHSIAFTALRALLPTVPVEGS